MAFLALLKPILLNKYTLCAAIAAAIFAGGFFYGRASVQKAELKQQVKEVKVYVKERDRIRARYDSTTFDDAVVLSGRASENSKAAVPCD